MHFITYFTASYIHTIDFCILILHRLPTSSIVPSTTSSLEYRHNNLVIKIFRLRLLYNFEGSSYHDYRLKENGKSWMWNRCHLFSYLHIFFFFVKQLSISMTLNFTKWKWNIFAKKFKSTGNMICVSNFIVGLYLFQSVVIGKYDCAFLLNINDKTQYL